MPPIETTTTAEQRGTLDSDLKGQARGDFDAMSLSSNSRADFKAAIELIFTQNPRLAEVGSQEQYSAYLHSVFPESKTKDIFYHSSNADFRDEGFKPMKPNFDTINSIEGVYNFSSNLKFTRRYGEHLYAVLLDIRQPLTESCSGEYADDMDGPLSEALIKMGRVGEQSFGTRYQPELKDTDAFINQITGEHYIEKNPRTGREWGLPNQVLVAVFNPHAIHILGSEKDLHKFREYLNA